MKGRRRHRQRQRIDPVEAVLEEALSSGYYEPFYCTEHGKHFFLPGVRAECPICQKPCFTPMEWEYRNTPRQRRERRVQMLRNHLE